MNQELNKLTILLMLIFCCVGMSTEVLIAQTGTDIPGGDVSGTWTLEGAPYMVNGEITIPDGQTLAIEPGVEVIFSGHYKFNVQGRILAVGEANSAIIFTGADFESGWHGMRFINTPETNDTSKLVYCKLQHGFATGDTPPDRVGGAIAVLSFSKLLIQFCEITTNRTMGGLDSGGGGIYLQSCSPRITQNLIVNNNALGGHGGGILLHDNAHPILTDNIFFNNTAFGGGGIAVSQSESVLINNTITHNTADHGGGLDCIGSEPAFINTIFYDNHADDVGNEVHVGSDFYPSFLYCDVAGGVEAFAKGHEPGCPGYSGRYENNIDAGPMFPDFNGDFHLGDASPCIGAGIDEIAVEGILYQAPATDFDGQPRPRPAGSFPDIGAIEQDLSTPTATGQVAGLNSSRLLPGYPNPAVTEILIPYYLSHSGIVRIEIFTFTGKPILNLASGFHASGEHVAYWDTVDIPAGIYVCTMKMEGVVDSKKIIVQK